MALVIADRVREQSTTTGAGTFTLTGAVVGFQTFSSAIGNGNTTYYTISNPGTTEWEVGVGTVSAGQLARTTILSSSNAGSLVNFTAGTKDVFVTYPAEKSVNQDVAGAVDITTLAAGTISATGAITSTVTTGTAPLVIASTTKVSNLNVDLLDGADWAAPPSIGSGTANAAAFTTISATGDVTFSGTGATKLQASTTANRPGTPAQGMLRYNTTLSQFEGYNGTDWGGIGGAQAGGAIQVNNTTASVSYTIATGTNGFSVGPITTASGVTITVSAGQRWVVI
jgi:hypothetical protein